MDRLLELKEEPTIADIELAAGCYHDGGEFAVEAEKVKYFAKAAICGLQFIEMHPDPSYQDYYLASLCLAKAGKYTKDISLKGDCIGVACRYADSMVDLYNHQRKQMKTQNQDDDFAVNLVNQLKTKK